MVEATNAWLKGTSLQHVYGNAAGPLEVRKRNGLELSKKCSP